MHHRRRVHDLNTHKLSTKQCFFKISLLMLFLSVAVHLSRFYKHWVSLHRSHQLHETLMMKVSRKSLIKVPGKIALSIQCRINGGSAAVRIYLRYNAFNHCVHARLWNTCFESPLKILKFVHFVQKITLRHVKENASKNHYEFGLIFPPQPAVRSSNKLCSNIIHAMMYSAISGLSMKIQASTNYSEFYGFFRAYVVSMRSCVQRIDRERNKHGKQRFEFQRFI